MVEVASDIYHYFDIINIVPAPYSTLIIFTSITLCIITRKCFTSSKAIWMFFIIVFLNLCRLCKENFTC